MMMKMKAMKKMMTNGKATFSCLLIFFFTFVQEFDIINLKKIKLKRKEIRKAVSSNSKNYYEEKINDNPVKLCYACFLQRST